jgi:hypothetical protein
MKLANKTCSPATNCSTPTVRTRITVITAWTHTSDFPSYRERVFARHDDGRDRNQRRRDADGVGQAIVKRSAGSRLPRSKQHRHCFSLVKASFTHTQRNHNHIHYQHDSLPCCSFAPIQSILFVHPATIAVASRVLRLVFCHARPSYTADVHHCVSHESMSHVSISISFEHHQSPYLLELFEVQLAIIVEIRFLKALRRRHAREFLGIDIAHLRRGRIRRLVHDLEY